MGAGSAVLSKSLRNLEADKQLDFDAFRAFMGTHYKRQHAYLFRDLAQRSDPASKPKVTVGQLKEALEVQSPVRALVTAYRTLAC